MTRFLAAIVLTVCLAVGVGHSARGQPVPIPGCLNAGVPCNAVAVFTPVAATTLTLSGTSANVALPATGSSYNLRVTNPGAVIAYVVLGTNNGVIATTANIPIQPASVGTNVIALPVGSNTYIAGITAGTAVTLTIEVGTGQPAIVSGNFLTGVGAGCAIAGCTFTGPVHHGTNTVDGSAVAFTGGTINGTTIGLTTPAAANVTTLVSTGTGTITAGSGSNDQIVLGPHASGTAPSITSTGTDGLRILTGGYTLSLNEPLAQVATMAWTNAGNSYGINFVQTHTGMTSSTVGQFDNFQLNDSVNASAAGAWQGYNFTDNVNGTQGGRVAMNVGIVQTGIVGDASGAGDNFYTGLRDSTIWRYTQPGATSTAPLGRPFSGNDNTICGAVSGNYSPQNIYQCAGREINAGLYNSATAAIVSGLTIASLGANTHGFWGVSNMLWLYNTAGGNGWLCAICMGNGQLFPLDNTNGEIIGAKFGQGTNGVVPFTTKWGFELSSITFPSTGNPYDGGFFNTNGASMDGVGTLRLGTTYFTSSSAGLAIDAKGSVGTGATINTPGSGYIHTSGTEDEAVTAYGGIWFISVNSSGVPTAVTTYVQPQWPNTSTTPSTATPTNINGADSGSGLILNLTWNTTATTVAISPSGGATAIGGTLGLTAATWTDIQTCTPGQISVDASYIYVCTATNTVKRAALSTF